MYFDLSLNLYIVAAIAITGPLAMLAMDRAVARGWLQRSSAIAADHVGWADLRFMASFVLMAGLLATGVQLALCEQLRRGIGKGRVVGLLAVEPTRHPTHHAIEQFCAGGRRE